MSSAVEICNKALSELHVSSINSLTEPSAQAQRCNLWYDSTVESVLKSFDWQFNHKIKPLSLLDEKIHNWVYVYQYPSDCIHINRVISEYEEHYRDDSSNGFRHRYYHDKDHLNLTKHKVKYDVFNINGNRVIATNESNLRIDYRAREDNPDLFDEDFEMALVYKLGSILAVPILGTEKGPRVRSDLLNLYNAYMLEASENSENQQYSEVPDSEYITTRKY